MQLEGPAPDLPCERKSGLQLAYASFPDQYSVRQHSEKDMEKSSRSRVSYALKGHNLKGPSLVRALLGQVVQFKTEKLYIV